MQDIVMHEGWVKLVESQLDLHKENMFRDETIRAYKEIIRNVDNRVAKQFYMDCIRTVRTWAVNRAKEVPCEQLQQEITAVCQKIDSDIYPINVNLYSRHIFFESSDLTFMQELEDKKNYVKETLSYVTENDDPVWVTQVKLTLMRLYTIKTNPDEIPILLQIKDEVKELSEKAKIWEADTTITVQLRCDNE